MESKENIEIRLLAKQLEKYEDRYTAEVEKNKLELLKYQDENKKLLLTTFVSMFIAIAVAICTVGSNMYMKKNEIDLRRLEILFTRYQELEKKFVEQEKEADKVIIAEALRDLSKRLGDLVDTSINNQYVQLCAQDEARQIEESKKDSLEKIAIKSDKQTYGRIFDSLANYENPVKNHTLSTVEIERQKQLLISQLPRALKDYSNASIRADSSSIIVQSTIKQIQARNDDNSESIITKINWFREGWVMPFEEISILNLETINYTRIQIQVCKAGAVDAEDCSIIKEKTWLAPGEKIKFNYADYYYSITLLRLDYVSDPYKQVAYLKLTKNR